MQYEFGYIKRGAPTHKREFASLESAIRYGIELAQMNGAKWIEVYDPDGKMHLWDCVDGKWEAVNG